MVKISFQSVVGQKVEKENDGDKTEILIPHPMGSLHLHSHEAAGAFLTASIAIWLQTKHVIAALLSSAPVRS
ncbi:hypothetical protein E3U43_011466 [Larimichthys crocea]|uniref:Uncharacterized protein n=1 Tax=Larimichthys crocea TaxID=215358 RepID=A0ACD3QLH4_LARCR|nr:hypothetical protein E3U43_011466 [Larimichthys crocea]